MPAHCFAAPLLAGSGGRESARACCAAGVSDPIKEPRARVRAVRRNVLQSQVMFAARSCPQAVRTAQPRRGEQKERGCAFRWPPRHSRGTRERQNGPCPAKVCPNGPDFGAHARRVRLCAHARGSGEHSAGERRTSFQSHLIRSSARTCAPVGQIYPRGAAAARGGGRCIGHDTLPTSGRDTGPAV